MESEYIFSGKRNGRLLLEHLPQVNYAMLHNSVRTCVRAVLFNKEEEDWHQVVVSVQGELVKPSQVVLDTVGAGQHVQLTGLGVEPEASQLVNLTESVESSFFVVVTVDGEEVLRQRSQVRLLPFDHWAGIREVPELLSAFVVPNHPALDTVCAQAATYLEKWTGSSSLDAYQTQDRNRVRHQVAAIYEALRQQNIVYCEPPASFEATGQRVRLADRVLSSKMGTCLDTTLLFASCLESVGIHPVLVVLRGHTLVGAWLQEHFYAQKVCDDGSYLLKESADGINNLVLVETTCMLASRSVPFDNAVETAERAVRDNNNFELFVDVYRCRLDNIRPLPQRTQGADGFEVALPEEERPVATESVRQPDHYALHLDNNGTEVTKQTLWERKLLDFSLRNNLINCRIGRRVIPFVTFDMDALEDNIHDGHDYSILPYPKKTIRPSDAGMYDSPLQAAELKGMVGEEVKTSHRLISYLDESELSTALKFIYRASRNSLEENGANTLFLAMGMLKWFENERSMVARYAPLLLMPVNIIRKGGTNYILRSRDEDTILNITLVELLKQQFKINLSMLDPLPVDEHGVNVNVVVATVREAIKQQARWNVMEETVLGLFSFNKFVMWNDIHNNASELKENEVVRSLMEGRVKLSDTDEVTDARQIDQATKPSDFAIPVDVDSSQLEAVVESGKGKSFILYGPPGTGKSQTITNMIANALYQGKRVLFVAEKMAALEVVQKRLSKIGLDPFCLELHSNKVTKTHFLSQMQKALSVTRIREPEQYQAASERLHQHRQQLIGYIESLHRKDATSGFSLYDCIARYLSIEGEEISGRLPRVETITRERMERWVEDTLGLETLFQVTGHPADHPLRGLLPKGYTQQYEDAIRQLLTAFGAQYAAAQQAVQAAPVALALNEKELDWAEQVSSAIAQLPPQNRLQFMNTDPNTIYGAWQEAGKKWFLPRFFAKRELMEGIRQFNAALQFEQVPDMLNAHAAFQRLVSDYCMGHNADYQTVLAALLAPGAHERIGALVSVRAQLRQIDAELSKYALVEVDDAAVASGSRLTTINDRLAGWLAHLDKLKDWTLWADRKLSLQQEGLYGLTEYIENENASPRQAADALQKGVFHLLTMNTVEKDSMLARFNGLLFEELVDKFRQDSSDFQNLTKEELYYRLASRIPSQTAAATANSEMGILKRNISNGGRGTSIRKIIDQIPTLLPKLCPCMLMSPISVAQYIDMAGEKFDLVIFDEASQMPTSEAVGAIARGKALVCVGDPKQMPPTSFFTTQQVDEDEVEIDDMDSILDDCITLSMPGHYLSWHYRSKHESLIAFSNQEYYEGKLHTFPSVDDRTRKVSLVPVQGVYDKGRTRSNMAEAKAVVDEVVRRLQDPQLAERSIGIVSFSKVQQNLIEDVLLERLAELPELEKKAYQCEEPIFIKNLENVQGDERDVILFSVGYGQDKDGNVSMNFGPLNNDGGERRLNVAVSRARYEMVVYATLRPEQIDLKRSRAKGVEGLKKFLEFASEGTIITNYVPQTQSSALSQDADLVGPISEELRNNGYDVETAVGRSQFKIDLAVVNPDNPEEYILAILCDGRNYYETKTTRDREIVQPGVLRGLHWNVMRVWAVDWYQNREQVVSRILKRLSDLRDHVEIPESVGGGPAVQAFVPPSPQSADVSAVQSADAEDRLEPYKAAELGTTQLKFDERNTVLKSRVADRVEKLLAAESPITSQLVYKRMAKYLGLSRAGQRVQDYLDLMLMAHGYRDSQSDETADIWWASAEQAKDYRSYRPCHDRDASEIPVVEVANAVLHAMEQSISLPADDLRRAVVQLMKFSRRGAKIDALTEKAVALLIKRGDIQEHDGRLSLV